MSVSERALMESDLIDIVEGEFALPVVLRGPDGETYDKNANDPTGNTPLMGNVLYDSRRETPTEGGVMVTKEMVVTLRRTSCPPDLLVATRLDKWEIRVPQNPTAGAPMVSYMLGPSKSPDFGQTIGTIRLYPKRAKQSA